MSKSPISVTCRPVACTDAPRTSLAQVLSPAARACTADRLRCA